MAGAGAGARAGANQENQQHPNKNNAKELQQGKVIYSVGDVEGPKGIFHFPHPGDEQTDEWLKFTVYRKESTKEVRVRIWPKSKAVCSRDVHKKELYGTMKQNITFVLLASNYSEGVCMVEQEVAEKNGRWETNADKRSNDFEVIFEGNGDKKEKAVAVAFSFVVFIGFSLLFLQLWYCLLKTGRFM